MARLREANVPSAPLAAELLLMYVLGRDRAWLYSHPETALDSEAAARYFSLIARRAAGEPVQHLTGKQEFWGLEFEVTPAVLIPRPETEHVIEAALERIADPSAPLRVADIGTGSGCLAIALARELPSAQIFATDISFAALEIGRRNAQRLGVGGRVQFAACDLLAAVSRNARFDLVVSNPPYVGLNEAPGLPNDVREFEPPSALFAGPAGTDLYGELIRQAGALLERGGNLALEIGWNAEEFVRARLGEAACWRNVATRNDLAGIPRVIAAQRV